MTQSQELIVAPDRDTAMQVFTKPGGLEPYLTQVRSHIDDFVPDISSAKGRKEVASMAAKVARSKTALDGVGKELVAELKELPRKVDAERKRMRDTLDKWRDEVRLPLTEIEEAKKARDLEIQERMERLAGFAAAPTLSDDATADEITDLLRQAETTPIDRAHWDDRLQEAIRTRTAVISRLEQAFARRKRRDQEQAELERLRKEAEARAEQDRIREAEDLARKQAAEAAERERAEAAAALRREREERELAEKRAAEAAERAEQEKIEAVRREREQALERERERARRLAAEKQAKEEEARKAAEIEAARQANYEHRREVNIQAMGGLMEASEALAEEQAKDIIKAIAAGRVPHVKIEY